MVEAMEIRDQVSALLEAGGFKLRKWASNSKSLLYKMRNTSSDNQLLELDKFGAAKTLGISWNPEEDAFQYKLQIQESYSKIHTKREILSQISQIFDPLSLLGPIITRAKILMQRIWRSNVDWDDLLPPEINAEWTRYIQGTNRALERSECLVELGATL